MFRLIRLLFHRLSITIMLMLIQIFMLVSMVVWFSDYFVYFYSASTILGLLLVLEIINNRSNPAYKLAWIILILLLPVFGAPTYLLFGNGHTLSLRETRRMRAISERMPEPVDQEVLLKIRAENPAAYTQSCYIAQFGHSPPYQDTCTEYLPTGELKFQRLKEELEKAEHYIFLEYFIIQQGIMWDSILEILQRKAAQGLDVRVMYDDMGCMFTLPSGYNRTLEKMGILCCVFNPFRPVLSPRFNNRDHRKIVVIDGHTAFTGGVNLADEYINEVERFGHWKDTAIMLKGDGVWGFTTMFLATWDYTRGIVEDYQMYRPRVHLREDCSNGGYVQPFADSPMDHEAVGETIYMNLLYKAEKYVYITTPYLIVGSEMLCALTSAAKSGVDVRIITPHIPDKWYVHAVTRSNYQQLIEGGVKIYEYTPGFIHAKSFVVDDRLGVVGTVNLDYRSLYLHFECGVWLYGTHSVAQIKEDFEQTLTLCQQITLEECRSVPFLVRVGRAVLGVFAPMM